METAKRIEVIERIWFMAEKMAPEEENAPTSDKESASILRDMVVMDHRELAELADVIPFMPMLSPEGDDGLNPGESFEAWELREALQNELLTLDAHDVAFRLIEALPDERLDGEMFEHGQRKSLLESLIDDLAKRSLWQQARHMIAKTTLSDIDKADFTIRLLRRSEDPVDIDTARMLLRAVETDGYLAIQRYMNLWSAAHQMPDRMRAVELALHQPPVLRVKSQLTIAKHTGEAQEYIKAVNLAQALPPQWSAEQLNDIVNSIVLGVVKNMNPHIQEVTDRPPIPRDTIRAILHGIPERLRKALVRRIEELGGTV